MTPATSSGTGAEAFDLRFPVGFVAAPDKGAEPYANTGWAEEVVHKKTGIEMVFIPAGVFMMGSDAHRPEAMPAHQVRITKPFYLGKYEVTKEQWQAVMGSGLWHFKDSDSWQTMMERYLKGDPRIPIAWVSWDNCQEFLAKAGNGLRLPTEAEWEYACRAGTTTAYSFGEDAGELGRYAWYLDNSGKRTHPVGTRPPNAWGLYGMHGNVFEWCEDWYDEKYYSKSPVDDPPGPRNGKWRVIRSGSWSSRYADCRSFERHYHDQPLGNGFIGFRVCVGLPAH